MSARTITLDPEIIGILTDLQKRGGSTLLRSPLPTRIKNAWDESLQLSASRTGWLPEERELLTSYREELAETLVQLYYHVLRSRPHPNYFKSSRERSPRAAEDLRRDLDRLRRSSLHGSVDDEVDRVVDDCLRPEGAGIITASQLSWSLLRLRDSEINRCRHGFAMVVEGRPKEGARLLEKLHSTSGDRHVRYLAALNTGLARIVDGQAPASWLALFYEAIAACPGVVALFTIILNAPILGDLKAAEVAAALLNDRIGKADKILVEARHVFGSARCTSEERAQLRRFRDKTTGAAGRLIDAILEKSRKA